MTDHLPYSRPEATAARLGDLAPDRHRFTDKRVLLTGERHVLMTENGRECLVSSLRLLPRICSNVSVFLPAECGQLRAECEAVAARISFGTPIEFLSDGTG